ncbi:MAG: UDP-N-acetylmuramoyl-tripeptide--D-alanyl-D-alanine ligase, partial [Candidatus Harrisonbacteria bacterium]|nr:UDP-N-acetylmuramoyl-tripeptide--D-alanyl-D-alanine ligase [Candidatus Harrisonbacteria bacterium]
MKSFLLKQLQDILRLLARATIAKYRPYVIAVTGSVSKTSAKEAVHAALKDYRRVRRSRGNFNNELGVPLAVLGDWRKI